MVTIPVVGIRGFLWGDQVLVVTEHSFGVHVQSQEIRLSAEHTEFRWVHYEAAHGLLKWDSNKNALWELDFRLSRGERSRE